MPPAGRAEFIVQAPPKEPSDFHVPRLFDRPDWQPGYPTGTGENRSSAVTQMKRKRQSKKPKAPPNQSLPSRWGVIKFADLAKQKPTTLRKIYFSEEFGGTNGPIQFYITVDGQKQKVFEPNEKPVITTQGWRGRRLDHRKPRPRDPCLPHPPDPFHAPRSGRKAGAPGHPRHH